MDIDDEIVKGSMLINKGEVNSPALQQFLDKDTE